MKLNKLIIPILIMLLLFAACQSKEPSKASYDAWYLNSMKLDDLLKHSQGESQTIAFIDTGLSPMYQEMLKDRIVSPYNCIDGSTDVIDENGHGTAMISIVAGSEDLKVYGLAPKSKIMPIKVTDKNGRLTYDMLLKGIDYAIDNGATIICLSVGGYKTDEVITEAIDRAISRNITVVASAGDYGQKDLLFPANLPQVISVEAKGEDGTRWEYSNQSDESVLSFPGMSIRVLNPFDNEHICNDECEGDEKHDRKYDGSGLYLTYEDGTSHACALASGYIALIRDYYQNNGNPLSNNDLISMLKDLNTKNGGAADYLKPFNKQYVLGAAKGPCFLSLAS